MDGDADDASEEAMKGFGTEFFAQKAGFARISSLPTAKEGELSEERREKIKAAAAQVRGHPASARL